MKKLLTLIFILSNSWLSNAQFKYPPSREEIVTETFHGITYNDPYRWLEYNDQPGVETWFKDQAEYTNSILNTLNGRDELIATWKELDNIQPARYRSISFESGRYFYKKTLAGENVGKLYYREGLKGKELLLFDPKNYIKGKTLTLSSATPSFDGKKVAIAYTEQGAEVDVIKIMDVASRKFLPDSIYPAAGVSTWTFDNSGFFYTSIKSADNKDPESRLNSKFRFHLIGNNQNMDKDFFSNTSYPEMNIDPSVYPYVYLIQQSKDYIFSGCGSVQPEFTEYFAPISEINNKKINWKPMALPADKLVRGLEQKGNNVYAISYDNAKNYKLVATTLPKPDWKNATVIAKERTNNTLETFTCSKDYLLMVHSDGINNTLSKYDLKTKQTTEIKLPNSGSINIFCTNKNTNDISVGITAWNKPYTLYKLNAVTNTFSADDFNLPPSYPAAYKDLEVEEVEVKGHDGVMIPLSIIYKKGTKRDGSNVCFLNAYGAYGSSSSPGFNVRENTLVTKGVVLAIPHVRGGSEKGEEWYRAGYKTTKPNTWKDFISCTEYMIEKGFTSKGKIAGTGTSAGGILISRAITERPDLFTAAICNVGCANAMRLEFGSNGPVNIPEFGTIKNEVECRALYEMDGMQHVKKGTNYPAVLCVAGWNDSRVAPWQPGKFAAAMQNANSSDKPILMKVNYDNGHFTEDKNVTFSNFADQYAFAMWQCGHPDFQVKK